MNGTLTDIVAEFREQFDSTRRDVVIPDNTCPQVDDLIRYVKRIVKIVDKAGKDDSPEKLFEALQDIGTETWDMESLLEDLRSDNQSLRDAGKLWYELCKDYLPTIEEKLETVNETI